MSNDQQKLISFTADELNDKKQELGKKILSSVVLREFARQFVANFMKSPTELIVSVNVSDYYLLHGEIVKDKDRNIFEASKEIPGLWVLNEHFTPVNAMLFLYSAFDVAIDIEPELKSQEKAITTAVKLFDRFNTASKYKAITELMLNYLPDTEMNSQRAILFKNGVAWNGKRIITDIDEIKKYHFTTVCPCSLEADISQLIQSHSTEYNAVNKFLLDLATVKDDNTPMATMNNYEDIINFLGYIMTLYNRQKQFFVCLGETTNNGKSTFLRAVSTALGKDYAVKLNSNSFAKPTFRSKQEFSGIGEADGKLFAYASEPDKNTPYDAGFIKDITNGIDTIRYARKYASDGEMNCNFIPVQECNNIPCYDDDTLITSGRIIILPFQNQFERGSASPLDTWTPCHYSILLAMAINQAIKTDGKLFTWHNSKIAEYVKQNDTVGLFVDECCEPTEKEIDFPETQAVYNCYTRFVKYAFPDNIPSVSVAKFNAEMEQRGYFKKRISVNQNRRTVFYGITLKNRK